MATAIKLKPEIQTAMNQAVKTALDSITGTDTSIDDLAEIVLTELCSNFDNEQLLELLPAMVRSQVKSAVDKNSIEKQADDQLEMLSSDWLNSLAKTDDGHVCKAKDMNWPIMEQIDRRKRENLKRQNRAFEKWNNRRELCREAGMADDFNMRVGDVAMLINSDGAAE